MSADFATAAARTVEAAGFLLLPMAFLGIYLYGSQFALLAEIELWHRRNPGPGTVPRINRRIRFHTVLVATGPLLGLLGTVGGMLVTFDAISTDGPTPGIAAVSGGISQALVTTQLGLLLAIPGTLLLAATRSRRNHLEALLHRLSNHAPDSP